MFSPRHATSREWFRAGFFAALGAAILALVALIVWQFSSAALAICIPFVIGLLLALLLDPLADRLERRRMPRLVAVLIVFGTFLFLLIGFGYVVIPALINEAGQLQDSGPTALTHVSSHVSQWLTHHKSFVGVKMPSSYSDLSKKVTTWGSNYLQQSTGGIQAFLQATVGAIISTVIALIVAFFLLKDIDMLRARFFFLLPTKARAPMEQVCSDIGGVFADYLRGLLIVCSFYGLCTILMLYSLSFTRGHGSLAGYALLVGSIAGVLYAVPYLGSTTTALITFLVAFASAPHGGLAFGGLAVALTLALNQIFDNIITPRVVGGGVGLHPVIAIFALILGAELFHIWGMLLSVPVAASVQVILFRMFPHLTEKTPAPFLRAQGVPRDQIKAQTETSKVVEGDHPEMPQGQSELSDVPAAEGAK